MRVFDCFAQFWDPLLLRVTSTSFDYTVYSLSYCILCYIRLVALKNLLFSAENEGVYLKERGYRGGYEWKVWKFLVRCIVWEKPR